MPIRRVALRRGSAASFHPRELLIAWDERIWVSIYAALDFGILVRSKSVQFRAVRHGVWFPLMGPKPVCWLGWRIRPMRSAI